MSGSIGSILWDLVNLPILMLAGCFLEYIFRRPARALSIHVIWPLLLNALKYFNIAFTFYLLWSMMIQKCVGQARKMSFFAKFVCLCKTGRRIIMQKTIMKRILHTIAALVLAMVFFMSIQVRVHASDPLFEHEQTEVLAPGVNYRRVMQVTTGGLIDVHMIFVPINDPYIYVAPVASTRGLGLRETTTNLLSSAEAIGGINADFFGLASNHSVHFGPMAFDGELLGLNSGTNHARNEFATFFLDMANDVSFNYMRSTIRFYNNGQNNVYITSINIIGHEFHSPVIIDRNLMTNTAPILARFSGSTKFVVENNVVTYITQALVDVPENGYILVIPSHLNNSHRHLINVGDSARLDVRNSLGVDFSRIQAAIGGGGLFLRYGETVASGVAPNARHPRSAMGVNRDGDTLILMVVDGRNHSIGATNAEMAAWMRRAGAWHAMHFDGGGSSTMVVREDDGRYVVVNTPSDGGQRRVINALGVFDSRPFVPTSTVPALAELRANPGQISVLGAGTRVNLSFSGVATSGNPVPVVPLQAITRFEVVPPTLGVIEDGVFIAGEGSGHIVASVGGINTYIPVSIGGAAQHISFGNVGTSFIGYPEAYVTGTAMLDRQQLHLEYSFRATTVTQAAHLALSPAIQLPAGTVAITIEVQGDNSGHWLRGRVRDANGQHHIIDFIGSINFNNWQAVTANLPTNAPGPFALDRIYAVQLNSNAATSHTLRFNFLEAIVAPPAAYAVPQGPVFRDQMWAQRDFANVPAGTNHRFQLPGSNAEYSFTDHGAFSVTTMSLSGRRLSLDQWELFLPDIRSTTAQNVVIMLDDNTQRGFRYRGDFEFFHQALLTLQAQGRNIFVVSNTASATTVNVLDNIRYINLASTRGYINFRTSGNEIWWAD